MDKTLNFIEVLTVEQFKTQEKVSRIDIRKSPTSNKLFCTYGSKSGAVSSNGLPEHPMISLVNPTLDREPNEEEKKYIGTFVRDADGKVVPNPKANGFFYLVHEEGKGAPVLASF